MNFIMIIVLIVLLITLYLFTKNLSDILFDYSSQKKANKRLEQLKFDSKSKNVSVEELIDKITEPFIKYLLPKFSGMFDLKQIEIDLRHGGWNHVVNPKQYVALNLITKMIGILTFLFFLKESIVMSLMWGGAMFFGLPWLLKNAVETRQNRLLSYFPKFIRRLEAYVSNGATLSTAIENTAKTAPKEWQEILFKMHSMMVLNNVESGFNVLTDEIRAFEINGFVALLKISYEQGGDLADSFKAQADKVNDLFKKAKLIQIRKREAWVTLARIPIMLAILVAFGAPVVGAMTNFSTM